MMRRGLTMIEMLLAVALLAMVMVAASQWLSVAAATQGDDVQDLQWRHAAERTLALIDDAIRAVDEVERPPHERIRVVDNTLSITTRSISGKGPEIHRYEFDENRALLEVAIQSSREARQRRPLIGNVRAWNIDFDLETHILAVEITGAKGQTVARRYQP